MKTPSKPLYPNVWVRLLAYSLDIFVSGIIAGIVLLQVYGDAVNQWSQAVLQTYTAANHMALPPAHWMIMYLLVQTGYFCFSWSCFRATPVQLLLNIRVISLNGQALSTTQSLIRFAVLYGVTILPSLVPILGPIIVVLLLFNLRKEPQHRGIHDHAAGSIVVSMQAKSTKQSFRRAF